MSDNTDRPFDEPVPSYGKPTAPPVPTVRHDISRDFILGGDATLTISFPKGANPDNRDRDHYTFHFGRAEPTEGFPRPAHFARMLVNGDAWVYVGKLDETEFQVHLTKRSKLKPTTWAFRLLNRTLLVISQGKAGLDKLRAAGFDVMHDGRCSMCGHPLTNPESVRTGIGPVCGNRRSK